MLSSTIVLTAAQTGYATDKTFTRFDNPGDRSVYHGPDHTLVSQHTLGFYRSFPKRNGNFLGTAKTSAKFTKAVSVLNTDGSTGSYPAIVEINFSFPVGTSAAIQLEMRKEVLALLGQESVMAPLNGTLAV